MSTQEIANQLESILSKDDNDNFIYDFLLAYGISKSVVTRLKKGDQNRSKRENEVLYPKKIIFRVEGSNNLLNAIDDIAQHACVLKHSPRFAIMTDFKHLVAKDLKLGKALDIELKDLPKHYDFFLPLAGSEVYHSANDNEADRNAAYKMATLYDHLIEENPDIYQSKAQIHHLNVFLSRLLFCFFAEDTGIFPEDSIFTNTLVQHTDKNGKDTHSFLDKLFARLDSKDTKDLPEFLKKFPYVNGGLFRDEISSPKFSAKARKILIELGELQWKNINPDIFGSMIQAVTISEDRDELNKHYTSVPNILKLIKPLFLDEYYDELEKANTVNQLFKLQHRIANAKFFDPACGSGNFLIITYKELRVLEIELIKKIIELSNDTMLNTLSLWLAEHQMNIIFEERLFEYAEIASILPLKSTGHIKQGNATRLIWESVCPINTNDEVYIIGNPPFEGSRGQIENQKDDLKVVFREDYKNLDYVCAWFYKGAEYIENKNAKCAFVSTNSICQGLQVALLWKRIFSFNVEIDFAYRSFKWKNNAKGTAGVTVIIVGLRNKSNTTKYLFVDKLKKTVKNINGYLLEGKDLYIKDLPKPISKIRPMMKGNAAIDDGNFLFANEREADSFKSKYPDQAYLVREFIGSLELINNKKRYCLWLKDASAKDLTDNLEISHRISNVRKWRAESNKPQTRRYALKPNLFMEDRQPDEDYLMIPVVSSEDRDYIPIDNLSKSVIANYSSFILPKATTLEFAIISSKMHMIWVDTLGGKLETRFRYSSTLCYNTFPFPKIEKRQEELLNQYVFDILSARANHIGKTLKWMYDKKTMPSDLRQAHHALDEAIEKCYRLQPFNSDNERLEYLFKLYEKMIAEEASNPTPKKAKR